VGAHCQHNPEDTLYPAARSPQAPFDHRRQKDAEEIRMNLASRLQLQQLNDLNCEATAV